MRARWWGVAAALWTLGYVLLYVAVIRHQGSDVAWWYVLLLWLASALASCADLTPRPRTALVGALVVYGACTLVAMLSIGVLLVPAVLACALALRPGEKVPA